MSGSTLTEISKHAFGNSVIKEIIIPNTVTKIKYAAFQGSIYIPNTDYRANSILEKITGGTISYIESYAFAYCVNLTSIDLSNIEFIGEYAFTACEKLSDIILPQCLTTVQKNAFEKCYLNSLTLYNTTTTFGGHNNMMANDGVIMMHIVDWSNKNVLANRLSEFPMAINYKYNNEAVTGDYTIPSTVTTLGEGALYHAAGLTGITLPASLTSIGQRAFGKCTTLTSITSNAITAPAVANANAFSEVTKSIPVTIPDNAATYYSYRHASVWKDFNNYRVSLQTVKDEAIMELNDAAANRTEQSIQDMLSNYIEQINAATSKAEVESICSAGIAAMPLAIKKIDCIAAVEAAAVGVVADNLQALIDGYVARINAATSISGAEAVRDEAIAAFQLMKDKQPMLDELEGMKDGVNNEGILNRIQGYINTISNPSTTLTQAQTTFNEARTILGYILEGYAGAFLQPTEPGLRLKVTKKDGYVYEFQTIDLESVEYYRAE